MEFNDYKKRVLWKISNDDRSNEGKIDDDIKDVCDFINSLENYCTLSSCSGRISVLRDSEKKTKNIWLFKTHCTISNDDLERILNDAKKTKDMLWIRIEPFILHVAAKNIDYALRIMKIAHVSGIKHSGIISVSNTKCIVEIQSVERANMILSENGKVIIADFEPVKKKLNALLSKTRKRLKYFLSNLKDYKKEFL